MTDHLSQIKQALDAGPTEGPWFSVEDGEQRQCINTDHHGDGYWIASCNFYAGSGGNCDPIKKNADFIASCNPTAIRSLIERLEAAERDAERARRCALKYLDYLGIKNRKQGLERDMIDPDMVGKELAPKDTK